MRNTFNEKMDQQGATHPTEIAATLPLLQLINTEVEQSRALHVRKHSTIPSVKSQSIISHLYFLLKHKEHIRSLVLVGSAAYNMNVPDSDIDIVIICTENGFETVQSTVCEREIEQMMGGNNSNIEYTVLSTAHIKDLLHISSPFVFSFLHGSILMDDGYVSDLKKSWHYKRPGTAFFLKSLREHVLAQHFSVTKTLFQSVKENKCSERCCKTKQNCKGLPSGHIFGKTIMRMLYITLPARGYMPLTKSDAIDFSREVYGMECAMAVQKAAELSRDENASLDYTGYKSLKKLAVKLYRESLVAAGMGQELIGMLKDVSNMVRGNNHRIKNEHLRACVL